MMFTKEKLKNPIFLFNAFVLLTFIILRFVANRSEHSPLEGDLLDLG